MQLDSEMLKNSILLVLRPMGHPVQPLLNGDIIVTVVKSPENSSTDLKVEASCEYSKFVFASGIQWAFGWANGSTTLVPPGLLTSCCLKAVEELLVHTVYAFNTAVYILQNCLQKEPNSR